MPLLMAYSWRSSRSISLQLTLFLTVVALALLAFLVRSIRFAPREDGHTRTEERERRWYPKP